MCYRNGYGCSYCGQCGSDKNEHAGVNRKGMSEKDFKEALDVLERLCSAIEEDYEDDPVIMIAVTPGEPLKLVCEEDAADHLPCFGEDDEIVEAPEVGLMMSYDRQLLFKVGDQKYLDGDALIYDVDCEGDVVSVTAEDIYRVQEMLKRRTVIVSEEDDEIPVISLN